MYQGAVELLVQIHFQIIFFVYHYREVCQIMELY